MGIFDTLKKNLLGSSFEDKIMTIINKPVFIKDFKKENDEIIYIKKQFNAAADENIKQKLQNELNYHEFLQESLDKVYFELQNSQIPFYGLSNLSLKHDKDTEDIDFLLITNQFCCILNCKIIGGGIEIDKQGNFSRWKKNNEKWTKEGIYSPIEQNRKAEIIVKDIVHRLGYNELPVISLVIFTNPKATLNFKGCSDEIANKVIKVDLLNTKLKELVKQTKSAVYEEKEAFKIADNFNKINCKHEKPQKIDYENIDKTQEKTETIITDKNTPTKNKDELRKALKAFRTAEAGSNNIPPYFVFNNDEMERIIDSMPHNKEDLHKIKGFGDVKIEKYGESILKIINN